MRTWFFVPVLLILTGCGKDNAYVLSGSLIDNNQSIRVEGVTIQVWVQRITSGIFEANYKKVAEQLSGADGRFSIEIESAGYTGVKLIFSKPGYFGWEASLNLDKLKNNHGIEADYQLVPKGWLKVHVKNGQPFDVSDYFAYRLLNPYSDCEECCRQSDNEFTGMAIDQTYYCLTAGAQDLLIQWSKRKNKELVVKTESYRIQPFDTTRIEFIY